jgi:LysM repeat protein
LVALAASIVAVLAMIGLGPAIAGADVQPAVGHVVVQPGESLWGIASRQFPGMDPRDAVGKLRSLNHLSSGVVHPGQRLVLR